MGPSPIESKLDALFNSLRGRFVFIYCGMDVALTPCTDGQNDEKDKLEVDSTMSYLDSKLGVNLENAELFIALEIVQAPNVGEITRSGFVEGWKQAG